MAPQFISSEHNDAITGTAYGDTLIYQVLNSTVGNATAGNVSSTAGDHWTGFSLAQGIKSTSAICWWAGTVAPPRSGIVTNSNGNTVISIDRDGAGAPTLIPHSLRLITFRPPTTSLLTSNTSLPDSTCKNDPGAQRPGINNKAVLFY
jgi:hypothetical protein